MTQRWIGIPEDQVLCGSEKASDLIAHLRQGDAGPLDVNGIKLFAIRDRRGTVVAFGQAVPEAVETGDKMLVTAHKAIRAAFHRISVGGPVVIDETWQ